MNDYISRNAALDAAVKLAEARRRWGTSEGQAEIRGIDALMCAIEDLPSADAQPERLTDDDFETIRIHLSAFKEELCNQQRWKEAEEYQRIIDRFMAFASAQPEIIRCKDCKWYKTNYSWNGKEYKVCVIEPYEPVRKGDDYCSLGVKKDGIGG